MSEIKVETLDAIDRKNLDVRQKLQAECQAAKTKFGVDPRGHQDKFSICARPRVMLQLMIDMSKTIQLAGGLTKMVGEVRLNKPVVLGSTDGDVVGWWNDIPLRVRSNVSGDFITCQPNDKIPESTMTDRRQAGIIRLHAHAGSLDAVRDQEV